MVDSRASNGSSHDSQEQLASKEHQRLPQSERTLLTIQDMHTTADSQGKSLSGSSVNMSAVESQRLRAEDLIRSDSSDDELVDYDAMGNSQSRSSISAQQMALNGELDDSQDESDSGEDSPLVD